MIDDDTGTAVATAEAKTEPVPEPIEEQAPATEAAPAVKTPEPFEAFRAKHFEADDAPYKEDWGTYQEGLRNDVWKSAQEYYEPTIAQVRQATQEMRGAYDKAHQGLQTLTGRLRKVVEEGMLSEDSFTEALRSVPDAWNALQLIGERAQEEAKAKGKIEGDISGSWAATHYMIAEGSKRLGKPEMGAKFVKKLQEAAAAGRDASGPFQEWLDTVKDSYFKAGLAEGRKGTVEVGKAEGRSGAGPDTATKGGGAAGIRTMADADDAYYKQEIDTPTYKAYRKQFGVQG